MRAHKIAAIGLLLGVAGLQISAPVRAADVSAEVASLAGGLVADTSTRPAGARSANSEAALVEKARAIAQAQGLVRRDSSSSSSDDLAGAYGKALELGTKRYSLREEVAEVDNALRRGDADGAREAIRRLYERAGRTPPAGEALDRLLTRARKVHDAQPRATEEFQLERGDDTVNITWDHAIGMMTVDVIARDPDGKPFRAIFPGNVVSRPQTVGDGLEQDAQPLGEPRVITEDSGRELRKRLNGSWIDRNGRVWEISGDGSSMTVVQIYRNGHRVEYDANYWLGKITGTHIVSDPRDIGDSPPLPDWVKRAVATRFKPPFKIRLEVVPPGARLEGTWHSAYVTYSLGQKTVESVHGRFAEALVLTRGLNSVVGAVQGDRP